MINHVTPLVVGAALLATLAGCSSAPGAPADPPPSRYQGLWSPVPTPAAVPVPGSMDISDQPSWTIKVTMDPGQPPDPHSASWSRGALVTNLPGVGQATLVYIPQWDQLQLTAIAPVGGRVVTLAELFQHSPATSPQ